MPQSEAQISTIAIVTCNRLPGLVRSLESYIANIKKFGRQVRFAIFDDTKDAAVRDATRAELGGLKAKHGVSVHYAGMEEKLHFAEALATRSAVSRSIIDFALFDPYGFGNSVGANRNASLLHTAGEMFYSADDDTVCEFFSLANYRPDVALFSTPNPTDLHVFPDKKTADMAVIRSDKNVLAMVEELLGRTAQECVDHTGLPLDVRFAAPEWVQKVSGGEGRVRLSWVGIFGDSGFSYPTFLLWLSGEARKRLLQDEARYQAIKGNRQILRAPVKKTLGPGPFCQTTALGLDNRQLLPPFMPVFRGEDIIFGNTLRHCWGTAYFGYVPWAIRHDPVNPRVNKPGDILIPASYVAFQSLIVQLMQSFNSDIGLSDAQKLVKWGESYQTVAGLPAEEFNSLLRDGLGKQARQTVEGLKKSLAHHGESPAYWARDVQDYIQALEAAAPLPEFVIPNELRNRPEPGTLCQKLIGQFGDLLAAWPVITQAAMDLRLQGTALAQEIK